MTGAEGNILFRPDGSAYLEYGDIRDRLVALPHNPWGSTAGTYVESDLFVVKHEVLAELVPDARSVFEIGALYGHFLVTAIDACPDIFRIGWVDNEAHTAGSNDLVRANLRAAGYEWESLWWTSVADAANDGFGMGHGERFDVVHVDGAHSYAAAIVDMSLSLAMNPKVILVDDTIAIDEVHAAVVDFCAYVGLEPSWHETVNGFAVIQP